MDGHDTEVAQGTDDAALVFDLASERERFFMQDGAPRKLAAIPSARAEMCPRCVRDVCDVSGEGQGVSAGWGYAAMGGTWIRSTKEVVE
jgi:hypothetical protein